jgi:hypothetical protein
LIPSTAIHFNDDGTAWVVGTEWWATNIMRDALDRPCDTCGGRGWIVEDRTWGQPEGEQHQCPAECINGRHTLTVEVAWQTEVDAYEYGADRVSVVPGMVLPIVEEGEDAYHDPDVITADLMGWYWHGHRKVTLPPDAKVGGYAVKVVVYP